MDNLYLALGDSITTGYGVGTNMSFATRYYSSLLSSEQELRYVNFGVNGLTCGSLVTMLQQQRANSLIASSKVMSITIGSNDLLAVGKGLISGARATIDLTLRNLNHHLMLSGQQIRAANPSALVKISTIYHPLLPLNQESLALTRGLVKKANRSIMRMAREYRFVVVPVAKAFSGREQLLLGPDHLHPNLLGHQVIANLYKGV